MSEARCPGCHLHYATHGHGRVRIRHLYGRPMSREYCAHCYARIKAFVLATRERVIPPPIFEMILLCVLKGLE